MSDLLPCPCGKVPDGLCITEEDVRQKWKYVSGSCCGAWEIEFRAQYMLGDDLKREAAEAWNAAPRTGITKAERAVVEAVVDSIFTNGVGEKAERLVLVDCHGKDLGGWGKTPLIDRICAALDRARKGEG